MDKLLACIFAYGVFILCLGEAAFFSEAYNRAYISKDTYGVIALKECETLHSNLGKYIMDIDRVCNIEVPLND